MYFKKYFKPVKNITSYQRFVFSDAFPGEVEMSSSDNLEDKCFKLLLPSIPTTTFSSDTLPLILQPEGMSNDRALYLYKNIRQFCHAENRDTTCPAPDIPEDLPQDLPEDLPQDVPEDLPELVE